MTRQMTTVMKRKIPLFFGLCASALLLSAFCCNPIFPCASSAWQVYASTSFAGADNGGDQTSVAGQRIDQLPAFSDAFGYVAIDSQGNVGAAITGSDGIYTTSRPTGTWILYRGGDLRYPDTCNTQATYVTVGGGQYMLHCDVGSPFDLSPSTIDNSNLPSYLVLSGTSVSSQYGMPQIDFYDWTGKELLSATVESVSSDGTSMTLPTPTDMTYLTPGQYGAIVYVVNSDGSLTGKAGAHFTVVRPGQNPGDCGGIDILCP